MSEERKSKARRISDELVLKNAGTHSNLGMEKQVLEQKFQEELASSGFNERDIHVM
jgi:hypothetical protein